MTIMEKWRDEYFAVNGYGYKEHVNKFIDYLLIANKADTPNNIDINDVDASIGHYVKLGKINSRATMESHIVSIKSLYDFLLVKGKTADIIEQIIYADFKNGLAKKYNLNEIVEREILDIEIIKEILNTLDITLSNNFFDLKSKHESNNYINRLALRLFIKTTLIAPAKKNVIYNLRFSNFDSDFRGACVNGVNINIPNSLRSNILSAINLRQLLSKNNPYSGDSNLLKYVHGTNLKKEDLNRWFATFLKEFNILDLPADKTSYSIESIMKTAINDMATRMTNPIFISKINGTKIGTIENTYYSGNISTKYKMAIDDAINWEVSKNKYYNFI